MLLNLKPIQWIKRRKLLSACLFLIGIVFYFSLPKPLFTSAYSTVICDSNNKLLSARIAKDGQWRYPQIDSLSPKFKICLIQFEDKYFEYHPGFNIVSISKAFIKNFKRKKRKSGGSTITMQLVRIIRGNPSRTYFEKMLEIWIAVRIECTYSKKSIINYYASNAPFGGNVVGIQAASWRYFGRSPENLSWAESAMLAVLPNAPSLIYPGRNHILLKQKRNNLLKNLFQNGFIDSDTYNLAIKEALPTKPNPLPQLATHLLQRIVNEKGEGKIYKTTVVKEIQQRTAELLEKHISFQKNNQVNNACALILDTKTGNVLAYIGNSFSANRLDNNDVDIISSARSSGSILKPILYASLLNDGKITANSLVEDVPMQIGSYAPKNFNLTYDGLVPANEALSRSLNVPAVKMLQQYGVSPFLYQLKKIGFTTITKSANHYGLSLILGGAEVSPFDVGSVYASMGRILDNYNSQNSYFSATIHPAKYLIADAETKPERNTRPTLSASSVWFAFNAMSELARPEEYSLSSSFSSVHKIAWKTGTSFGFRDAWAVGVNQSYTIVVWVGNADGQGRPGLTGINAAAPFLFSLFNMLHNQEWFKKPFNDITALESCAETGFRASEFCINKKYIEAGVGSKNTLTCSFHKTIHLDSMARYVVNSTCYPVSAMKHKSFMVLTPLQEFFYKRKHLDFESVPQIMEGCLDEANQRNFDLVYPQNGFRIYLPLNEFGQRNDLILNATHNKVNAKLFWYLDKEFIGETSRFHQMGINPKYGKHEIQIIDENGKSVKAVFEIISKNKNNSG